MAEQVVSSMQENNYARFSLAGVAVIDADWTGREIHGVPVVANEETAAMYVCCLLYTSVSANEQADLKKFRETFLNTVDGCSTERICRKIKTNYINI